MLCGTCVPHRRRRMRVLPSGQELICLKHARYVVPVDDDGDAHVHELRTFDNFAAGA